MKVHFVKRESRDAEFTKADAAVVIRRYEDADPSTQKPEWACHLGTTAAEDSEIERILPGFISEFDSLYSVTGGDLNGFTIDVKTTSYYYGEPSSSTGEVDAVINGTIDYVKNEISLEEMSALEFTGSEEEFGERLEKIRTILLNRSEDDTFDPF